MPKKSKTVGMTSTTDAIPPQDAASGPALEQRPAARQPVERGRPDIIVPVSAEMVAPKSVRHCLDNVQTSVAGYYITCGRTGRCEISRKNRDVSPSNGVQAKPSANREG